MPVKYWSFAGLMLTYWCNARCASCYVRCGPERSERMARDVALRAWRQLLQASPHGCRIHLSGGEPFGDWPGLLAICEAARAEGLAPLEKIETNAFWASDRRVVTDRIRALDAAGMGTLSLSADPYHQQYVPIERVRLAAEVAEDVLGAERVQVRWRDWLAEGCDTAALSHEQRLRLFVRYAADGRDRLNGRAAGLLAPLLGGRPAEGWADSPCAGALLRSKHVHVGPDRWVTPGVCAGIALGRLGPATASDVWHALDADHATRPIVSVLARQGPVGLLAEAQDTGYRLRESYASKCHLCWEIRRHLAGGGMYPDVLAPAWLYEDDAEGD